MTLKTVIVALLSLLAGNALATDSAAVRADAAGSDKGAQQEQAVEPIINYLSYGPTFASAGQPTEAQLEQQAAAGVEQVVYLAFSDQDRSLAHEDRLVRSLGMRYLHIPVDFQAPQRQEYELFAAAMALAPEANTLLHCQVNFRATAFAMLYRVLELGVPLAEAKAAMNSVWTPNTVWTEFLLDVLGHYGIDPQCDGCDWTPAE